MSQWEPNSAPERPEWADEISPPLSSRVAGSAQPEPAAGEPLAPQGRRYPPWFQIGPFFISALLFLSAFFAVFSPLPILLLGFRQVEGKLGSPARANASRARVLVCLAFVTNALFVFLAAGAESALVYVVFVAASTLALFELLQRKKTLEKAALGALLAMSLAAALSLGGYARFRHVNPFREIKQTMSGVMDQLATSLQSNSPPHSSGHVGDSANISSDDEAEATDAEDIQAWKQDAWKELPSAVGVIALILVWVNLLLLVRLNPGGLRERLEIGPGYFLGWKAPEWLVWPTIVSGVALFFDAGFVSEIGRSFFKIFMAVYAIQGLSVVAFFFQVWRLPRFFRMVGYLVAILLVLPLLLAIGFFDLWFDFRAKFRQV
jgi:hypothetical protein